MGELGASGDSGCRGRVTQEPLLSHWSRFSVTFLALSFFRDLLRPQVVLWPFQT